MLFKTLLPISVVALALAPAFALAAPWSYTDSLGHTVTLDHVPTRIIASQDAAAGLIPLGIRPIAIYADGPIGDAKALQGLNLTGIEIISQTWGEVDIEKAAALEPELVIAEYWPLDTTWSGGSGVVDALTPLAPITGPTNGDSILKLIEGYEEIAASLGADLDEPAIAADKAAFETALEAFKGATAAKPNLTVLALWAGTDSMSIAATAGSAELVDFARWGLKLIDPEVPEDRGYWETLSWENADKYQPDLIIVDNRSPATLETALAQPIWTLMKAAEAGAVTDWPAFWLRNYHAYGAELDKLTAAINAADENLTP